MDKEALKRAVEIAGGQTALARTLGVRQSSVWDWIHTTKQGLPPKFAREVERLTGVPRHELRPDVFDPPEMEVSQ